MRWECGPIVPQHLFPQGMVVAPVIGRPSGVHRAAVVAPVIGRPLGVHRAAVVAPVIGRPLGVHRAAVGAPMLRPDGDAQHSGAGGEKNLGLTPMMGGRGGGVPLSFSRTWLTAPCRQPPPSGRTWKRAMPRRVSHPPHLPAPRPARRRPARGRVATRRLAHQPTRRPAGPAALPAGRPPEGRAAKGPRAALWLATNAAWPPRACVCRPR